ncbi:MAG: DUF2378 family protein [Myxococcaceae bacterium]|nr:DUF2378 family protein [Myxococcaceae bacterium]
MNEPVVFGTAFEALLKTLPPPSASLRAVLAAEGLRLDRPLQVAYPFQTWQRCLWAVVKDQFSHLAPEQAFNTLGLSMTRGFRQTLMGSATFPLIKVVGLERSLMRSTNNSRTMSNAFVSTATRVGEKRVALEQALMPEFVGRVSPATPAELWLFRGTIEGLLVALGTTSHELDLEVVDVTRHQVRLGVRWS